MTRQNSTPLLSVIIVSYNTRDMTLRCLETLQAQLRDELLNSEVWLVDNASRDGSAQAIREAFPTVNLIANTRNLGFGAANNLALEKARGRYLLLLNSDAFPVEGALETLCKYLREHPNVGAVGPRLLNADGSLQASCWKFPSPARSWFESVGLAAALPNHPKFGDYYRWAHDEERAVDFVIGACLLLRREVYEQVGGFDENFFLYAEETDWQKRMTQAGWSIVFLPDAQVTHLGGASGYNESARVNAYFYDGWDRFARKHHGTRGWLSMRAASALGSAARWLAFGALSLAPSRSKSARVQMKKQGALLKRQLSPWRPQSPPS